MLSKHDVETSKAGGVSARSRDAVSDNGILDRFNHKLVEQNGFLMSLADRVQTIADRVYGPQPEGEGQGPTGLGSGALEQLECTVETGDRLLKSLELQISRLETL